MWNPIVHSDEENLRLGWLRAVEFDVMGSKRQIAARLNISRASVRRLLRARQGTSLHKSAAA